MSGQHQSHAQAGSGTEADVLVRYQAHRTLSWVGRSDYLFATNLFSVKLALSETLQVAAEFPILFSLDHGEVEPIIRLSADNQSNDYVGTDGAWLANYLPAALKASPFSIGLVDEALSEEGIAEDGVCWRVKGIDSTYILLVAREVLRDSDAKGSQAFYDRDGLSTPVRKIAAFAKALSEDMVKAKLIAKALWDFGLLVPLDVGTEDEDERLYRVDEKRVDELPRKHVESLRNAGGLRLIYGHLVSMGHLTPPSAHTMRLKTQLGGAHDRRHGRQINTDQINAFRRAVMDDLLSQRNGICGNER